MEDGKSSETDSWRADGNVRCAVAKTAQGRQWQATLKRPIQKLFPLEFSNSDPGIEQDGLSIGTQEQDSQNQGDVETETAGQDGEGKPQHQASLRARSTVRAWCQSQKSDEP